MDRGILAHGRNTEGWRGTQTSLVPAFAPPFADPVELASTLSEAAASAGEVPREPIRGGTLAFEEAVTLDRHLVVGDEVHKPGTRAGCPQAVAR